MAPAAMKTSPAPALPTDRKSTRLNSSHRCISYAVFCLKKKDILKALADPTRLELLQRIAKANCPLGCSDIRPALAKSAATLSHHIKELETAGLIEVTRN